MTDSRNQDIKFEQLRRRAEEKVSHGLESWTVSPAEVSEMIQEMQRTQQELIAEYEDLYEFAPCGYLTLNARGIISRANLTAVSLLSTEKKSLYRSALSSFIVPAWQDSFLAALQKTEKTGKRLQIELPFKKNHESERWIQTDLKADLGGKGEVSQWRITLIDISERKESEKILRRVMRVHHLRSVVSTIILQTRDEQDLLDKVCRAVIKKGQYRLAWIGYAEQYPEKTVRPVAQAGYEEGYLEALQITWADNELGQGPSGTALRTGRPQICRQIRSDPGFKPWRAEAEKRSYGSSAAFPFELEGEKRGSLNVYAADPSAFDREEVDILSQIANDLGFSIKLLRAKKAEKKSAQARKVMESELEHQRLISMRTDRLRSLGEMAAGIAHELNQPLVGVRGLAEHLMLALRRGWKIEYEQIREKLEKIVGQADRMTHIIQHVRSYSRQAGKPQTQPVDLNEVVAEALNLLEAQLRSWGIKVELKLNESLPYVIGNPFSLEEVVLNCLTNSRDAIIRQIENSGYKDIDHNIFLTTYSSDREGGKQVILEIRDTGEGIDPEKQESVFEPFFTTKGPEEGTGLGLAISKSIVEDFSGTINLQSEQELGTRITITLPAQDIDRAE